jgi:acyl-CoA synthetase (AMP-forming)/AMP-acid ligase II
MSPREIFTLRDYLGSELKGRTISDGRRVVSLTDILDQTCLVGRFSELSGRSVLLAVSDQLISALAMIEIDGVARRMLLCPPDLNANQIQTLIDDAEIDAIVTDQPPRWADFGVYQVMAARAPERRGARVKTQRATEWLMVASGTSGVPKIVGHTLEGLTGAIVADGAARGSPPVWATFHDVRRYGGLQVFLRAIIGGGSIVLTEPGEVLADHVARLNARGVTHMSGTPSHWRKLLISGATSGLSPLYVGLSGEIADQAVLDGLRRTFPDASIGHVYVSTEAGVGFAVTDLLEGFPAALIGGNGDGVEMKIEDGSLRIRSSRTAHACVGRDATALTDGDGFVDTGDMVELRGERYHFVGRRCTSFASAPRDNSVARA